LSSPWRKRGAFFLVTAICTRADACTATGDRMGLSNIAERLHENFQLLAKLTGELSRGPLFNINNNNVVISPDFSRAIARLV
jgi:hypothetical protein